MAQEFSEFLQKLKENVDIVDVASRYMTLTPKGKNYWACCPFHNEKTPSFSINREEQFFHCFGCKESGDVIKLTQQLESTDFMGAVEFLANTAKMEIPSFRGEKGKESGAERLEKRDRLCGLLTQAARYYYQCLVSERGKPARDYLEKRKISSATARRFGLGYSPDWSGLLNFLKKCGYTEKEMVEAGVAGEKNGRFYDSLGERLIVPIIDGRGQVTAFGGRVIKPSDFAKYKNSPETAIFVKSKTLFGMNLVKKVKNEIKNLILVEGYMDAISLYEAGYNNVIASMGTSLTAQQAKMIKVLVDEVYISYDGDFAGASATARGLDILNDTGLTVKVVSLPDGLDPDDVIKKRGKAAYDKLLSEALPLIDFKLFAAKRKYDLKDNVQKRKYVIEALKIIAAQENESLQDELLKKLGSDVATSVQALKSDLDRLKSGAALSVNKQSEATSFADAPYRAVRYILYAMLSGAASADAIDLNRYIFDGTHKKIYAYILAHKGEKLTKSMLFNELGEEEYDELYNVLSASEREGVSKENEKSYYEDCLKLFKRYSLTEQEKKLKEEYKGEINKDNRADIAKQLQNVTLELKGL